METKEICDIIIQKGDKMAENKLADMSTEFAITILRVTGAMDAMTQICDIANTNLCHLIPYRRGGSMETYEILRGLREDRDLTQQAMADFLKIGRTMYRRYETGEMEIPVRHLKKLCLFYGVSSDYLLGLPEGLRRRESGTQ